MTQLRTLIGYEPKASLGGEREEAEGSERDEEMMSTGAGRGCVERSIERRRKARGRRGKREREKRASDVMNKAEQPRTQASKAKHRQTRPRENDYQLLSFLVLRSSPPWISSPFPIRNKLPSLKTRMAQQNHSQEPLTTDSTTPPPSPQRPHRSPSPSPLPQLPVTTISLPRTHLPAPILIISPPLLPTPPSSPPSPPRIYQYSSPTPTL